MIYLQLFFEFLKIGMFAVGGGLATVPFLQALAEKYPWFDTAMLSNMIAVGESTPGPIGVNMATYAGITAAGIPGGIVATFGLVLPSYCVILIVARILQKFRENRWVNAAFEGLRPAVTGLIAAAGLSVMRVALLSANAALTTELPALVSFIQWRECILYAVLLFVAEKWKKLHPIWFIAAGAVVGIVLKLG
ncbi:MAG: chromate transporter [Clostridiaceae bacterium]|nr:chromate transporter [Clostridiaceae bacterium]